MAQWQWYRRWRGGNWAYTHFIGWQRLGQGCFDRLLSDRLGCPEWAHEQHR